MKNSLAIVSDGKTKTLAERRELAQERTSFEILTNPPDKFSNGDVIGFAPYFTTQFGLPHSAVKANIWQRHNGNDVLSITTDCPYGLPSGSKPRLLLAWIATWQVRHPNLTVIDLGKNVSRFLEQELGVPRTGRYIKDVQLEMIRLCRDLAQLPGAYRAQGDREYRHRSRARPHQHAPWIRRFLTSL